VLNELSIANCCSGLPRTPAVYRTLRPNASTYGEFFSTLLGIPDDVACPTEADIWRAEGRTPPPHTNGEEART
jgi:hypothetical protein